MVTVTVLVLDVAFRFWNMLSYLVNTLIFVLVGLVIAHRAFSRVDSMDWVYLVVLYFGSIIIRLDPVAMLLGSFKIKCQHRGINSI